VFVIVRQNAFLPPLWKVNAHSIMYVLRGSCRCQVVDNRGQTVFNSEVRQGQILVIPQNFAQLKQSTSDDFEWITIETNDNSFSSPIVGKSSALKGMPEEVLMNSYRISREEARMVKRNRGEEFGVFSPRSQQGRASA